MKKKRKKRQLVDIDKLRPARHEPLIRDGQVLAVLRPDDAAAALAEAERLQRDPLLTDKEYEEQFAAILQKQAYSYVGIACRDGRTLLNEQYEPLADEMKPGDSFVPYEQVRAMIAAQDEPKA